MTITLNRIAVLLAIVAAVGLYFGSVGNAQAAAPPGLRAVIATTSNAVAGPLSVNRLFPADQTCVSRVITTFANPIMLSFDTLSSTTVSATSGHLQAASTTVVYDAQLYGCGLWSAYGYGASTSVSLSEFQ